MGLWPSLAQILLIGSMPRRPQEEPLPHLPATFGRERNDHPLLEQVALLTKPSRPRA